MTFPTSEVVLEATGRGWIRSCSGAGVIVADGAGITLVTCVAMAGIPVCGVSPGIRVTSGIGAAGGCDPSLEVNSAGDSVAQLTEG